MSKKSIKRIKEIINNTNSIKELIDVMPFFVQEVNREYFKDNPDFDRPALSFSIEEGERLIVYNNEIKLSELEYQYYGIYKKDGITYALKEVQFNLKPLVKKKYLKDFEFLGTIILAFENIKCLHELNHPKNEEEVIRGLSTVSLKSQSRFLGPIFMNNNGDPCQELEFPTKLLILSGSYYTRLDLNNEWKYESGIIGGSKLEKRILNNNEDESYEKYIYKIEGLSIFEDLNYGFKFDGKHRSVLDEITFFNIGDPDEIKKSRKRVSDEIDGFYAAKNHKENLIKKLRNKKK